MKKVELLAPAGNFQALKGAINAGADAVYLGGDRYGARAYADNFSQEEICEGLHYAHVFGRKIYLTVNTLVKERELDGLYDFLSPLYEMGLDGVIVQDLGALCFIRRYFPDLPLHASTQMTLTGSWGAEMLKKEGVVRIVPARELSLEEIRHMKQCTGLEVETFIHGAMCYCYSGQCLFSSILGGRSGNRGRCAQPCRLPYRIEKDSECYPLSMRDMCTLQILPELIEAGIDSFKIEGRMKRPEYAAGVSAVYRKYIDLYYENPKEYRIDPKDMELLSSLYIRSNTGSGYYHTRNGKELLTLHSPSYTETAEELLKTIEEKYLNAKASLPTEARVVMEAGKEARITLKNGNTSIDYSGQSVQQAIRQPLSEEKIINQIQKSGNSLLEIGRVELETKGDIFMPIGAINELRRTAAERLEDALIKSNGLAYEGRTAVPKAATPNSLRRKSVRASKQAPVRTLHALVQTKEQLLAALAQEISRIYLDYGLLADCGPEALGELLNNNQSGKQDNKKQEIYAAAPYISRQSNEKHLETIRQFVADGLLQGVLIRNLESLGYFERVLPKEQMVLDAGLYAWNRESLNFFKGKASEIYLPVECNGAEWRDLTCFEEEGLTQSVLIYGRLPMMITAGCLEKTRGACVGISGITRLKDRYDKIFPVYHDCHSCYNVIYNSIPLSLHKLFQDKAEEDLHCRMDFTTEGEQETFDIIGYFKELSNGVSKPPVYDQYTTGHYKRGVE